MDVLLHATAQAADPRLLLVLAGDGSERRALERLADDLHVRLHLTGDVPWERIVELYAAADVFALLSEREPWGVVVNEAAACGLPLVLSERVGAAHDLVRDGENGFLVPPGDAPALAEAICRILDDRDMAVRMGEASARRSAEYAIDLYLDRLETHYRELVGAGPVTTNAADPTCSR
jgi:glycosyltransferase involved in cell wall biosynthesis